MPRPTNHDLVKFLDKEGKARWNKQVLQGRLDFGKALEEGLILGPLKVNTARQSEGVFWHGSGNYSRIRAGDEIALIPMSEKRTIANKDDIKLKIKAVQFPSENVIELQSQKKRDHIDPNTEFIAVPSDDFSFLNHKMKKMLTELNDNGLENHQEKIDLKPLSQTKNTQKLYEELNSAQQEAFDHAMQSNLSGCIQGPPGTGKSHLIRSLIQFCLDQGFKVGMTAFTHSAIDKLCSSLEGVVSQGSMSRVGDDLKIPKSLYSQTAPLHFIKSLSDAGEKSQFAAATAYAWCLNTTFFRWTSGNAAS